MPPPQREEVSAAFLGRMGNGRHGQGNGYETTVVVFHQRDVPEVHQSQVSVHITVDHFVRKDRKIKQMGIGTVDQVEDFPAIVLLVHLPLGDFPDMQSVALLDKSCSAGDLLRNLLGHVDAVFQPVVGLPEAQGLEMVPIIRIVILEVEGADVVESFHDTAFVVEVRESQRTGNLFHPMLAAEPDDRLDECFGNFLVVDEIHPAEADLGMVPVAVRDIVDDSGHTGDNFAFLVIGQILLALGIFSHGILGHVQGGHFVHEKAGHVVRASLVEFQRKLDESLEFAPALNGLDGCWHRFVHVSFITQIYI